MSWKTRSVRMVYPALLGFSFALLPHLCLAGDSGQIVSAETKLVVPPAHPSPSPKAAPPRIDVSDLPPYLREDAEEFIRVWIDIEGRYERQEITQQERETEHGKNVGKLGGRLAGITIAIYACNQFGVPWLVFVAVPVGHYVGGIVGEKAGELAVSAWHGTKAAGQAAAAAADKTWSASKTAATAVGGAVARGADAVCDSAKKAVTVTGEAAVAVGGAAVRAAEVTKDAVVGAGEATWDGTKAAARWTGETASGVWGGTTSGVRAAAGWVGSWAW